MSVMRRPVYVLGAGFSKAVSEHMPITDELGWSVQDMLGEGPWGSPGHASFEEELTVLSTPMPFLQGHENTARRARAEAITAGIASEMDARQARVTRVNPPTWLLQLVSIWHAERAIILTFNYDTLVEHAVGSLRPTVLEMQGTLASGLVASQVVFPAPAAAGARTIEEVATADNRSLQLLKLHGSLSWYWSSGDTASIVRDPSATAFGGGRAVWDVTGLGTLDRFLIPPVLSKDSYYSVDLAHRLWRSARVAVANASRMTILGYSLPAGDRITGELLRAAAAPVDIVNLQVGSADDPVSPIGRASALGMRIENTFDGPDAMANFTAKRLSAMSGASNQIEDSRSSDDTVVATVHLSEFESGATTFVISSSDGRYVGWEVSRYSAASSEMPPREFAYDAHGRERLPLDAILTRGSLLDVLEQRSSVTIEIAQRDYLVIGWQNSVMGRWPVIELDLAPASAGLGIRADCIACSFLRTGESRIGRVTSLIHRRNHT